MSDEIRSKIYETGDEKESSWPPRFGTNKGKGGVFHIDKETGELREGYPQRDRGLAVIDHNYISDDMPPTRNPLNPREIYTSKSKLRAAYKAAGAEEIGTAYDNGYRPEREREDKTKQFEVKLHEVFKEKLNSGRR